jgi:rod shape-determining protein MreC
VLTEGRILQKQNRIITSVFLYFFLSLILTAYTVRNPHFGQIGVKLYQTLTAPVQRVMNGSWDYLSNIWNGYLWLVETSEENQELRGEVEDLRSEVVRLRELSQDVQALRGILQLRTQTGYDGVVTSVIGADPSGWIRSVTVDRGLQDGVHERMPAVLGGAVVGQVYASALHSSNVLLLTDRTSGVAALIQRSRARGIVIGSGADDSRMEYVREEEDVLVGDTVVTSGFDGIFPKGLEIGQVTEVRESSGSMFKRIRVEPTVDLIHLETLFILTEYEK